MRRGNLDMRSIHECGLSGRGFGDFLPLPAAGRGVGGEGFGPQRAATNPSPRPPPRNGEGRKVADRGPPLWITVIAGLRGHRHRQLRPFQSAARCRDAGGGSGRQTRRISRSEGGGQGRAEPDPRRWRSSRFPMTPAARLLAKKLAPQPAPLPAVAAVTPRERKIPGFLGDPTPVSADSANSIPRLSLPDSKPVRPTPLPDRVPTEIGGPMPNLPARAELPTGPLTRQLARNVNEPPELPYLSPRPVADRAPLTDPTIEFTAQSAISSKLPLRTDPTGFIRFNLPDPFEHADAAKPRTPVIENPNRSLGNPPPPRQ